MSVKCIMTEKPTWPDVLSERKSSDASSLVELMSRLTMWVTAFFSAVFGVLVTGADSTSARVHSAIAVLCRNSLLCLLTSPWHDILCSFRCPRVTYCGH